MSSPEHTYNNGQPYRVPLRRTVSGSVLADLSAALSDAVSDLDA